MTTQRVLRRLALWVAMTICGVRPAMGDDSGASALHMNIDQAIDEAIHNNLSLIAERLRIPVAQAGVIAASMRPNPSISYETANLTRPNPFSPGSLQERTLALSVPIEGPGKRRLRIETAALGSRVAQLEVADALRRLRLDVATSYTDAVRASRRLVLARENARLLGDLVNLNVARVNAGALARLELTRSQTAMYLLRNEAQRAEIDLAAAQIKFLNTIGRKGYRGGVDLEPDDKVEQEAQDLADLETQALKKRPDYLAAAMRQRETESDLQLQRAEARVDPVAGLSYRRGGDVSPAPSWGVNVTLPLPFFDRNQGAIARAHAEKAQADAELAATEQQVMTEVRTAYAQYVAAKRILSEVRRDLIPSALQARDTSAYVYRTHGSSLIEFLDAQRAYNETMDSLYDAESACANARFQLDAATGVER